VTKALILGPRDPPLEFRAAFLGPSSLGPNASFSPYNPFSSGLRASFADPNPFSHPSFAAEKHTGMAPRLLCIDHSLVLKHPAFRTFSGQESL